MIVSFDTYFTHITMSCFFFHSYHAKVTVVLSFYSKDNLALQPFSLEEELLRQTWVQKSSCQVAAHHQHKYPELEPKVKRPSDKDEVADGSDCQKSKQPDEEFYIRAEVNSGSICAFDSPNWLKSP